jgi:hypothetical protein
MNNNDRLSLITIKGLLRGSIIDLIDYRDFFLIVFVIKGECTIHVSD